MKPQVITQFLDYTFNLKKLFTSREKPQKPRPKLFPFPWRLAQDAVQQMIYRSNLFLHVQMDIGIS